jgi:FkbM family methyltransferase
MKLEKSNIRGIDFYHRPAFSDLKTFEEVIGRTVYLKRGMKIEPGELWMDCGANVGAFALLACKLGAEVECYEPDPFHCELIEKNLRANNFKAKIHQKALVHDDTKSVKLFVGNNNQTWRNSIVKQWNDLGLKVDCERFDSVAHRFNGCKMDIEGAEMPILESTDAVFDKLVYEWSFDIDANLRRLWEVIERQQEEYRVEAAWSSIRYEKRDYETWQSSWFPACTNVFCYRRT